MEDVKIVDEKEEVTERQPDAKRALKVLAIVGIGAGIYGYVRGRHSGYRIGVQHGYIRATHDVVNAMGEVAEEYRKSREE